MLRGKIVIVFSAIAYVGNASAAVDMQPFDPVPGFAPPSIILDDPYGKSSMWIRNLPCGANRATVTIKLDKVYPNNRWLPVAKIRLFPPSAGAGADVSGTDIAAVVKAPTDRFGLNGLVWMERQISSRFQEGAGMAPEDLRAPLQINLAWTPDGLVKANFGGEFDKGMIFSEPISRIVLSVSWAKFEFIKLETGHAGPPEPGCTSGPATF
jgi:hypothetical protein